MASFTLLLCMSVLVCWRWVVFFAVLRRWLKSSFFGVKEALQPFCEPISTWQPCFSTYRPHASYIEQSILLSWHFLYLDLTVKVPISQVSMLSSNCEASFGHFDLIVCFSHDHKTSAHPIWILNSFIPIWNSPLVTQHGTQPRTEVGLKQDSSGTQVGLNIFSRDSTKTQLRN